MSKAQELRKVIRYLDSRRRRLGFRLQAHNEGTSRLASFQSRDARCEVTELERHIDTLREVLNHSESVTATTNVKPSPSSISSRENDTMCPVEPTR